MRLLSEQIKVSDAELQELWTAFSLAKNRKKREQLGKRSNAITAALLALEMMERRPRVGVLAK